MGAQLCSQAGAAARKPREPLRFHAEARGAQVRLGPARSTARRLATFHDGIVFSQRPVRRGERVALRVLSHERGWSGGLRVGFTRLDPARVRPRSLPPFVCPDLELRSPTWAAVLPGGARAGDVVRFWLSRRGRLCARVNAGPRLRLREGLPTRAPLWAVMDVYGTTKAIELLAPAGQECAVCLHHAANTCLVPCGHTHLCSCCAWRVFGDTARCPLCRWEIEAVVPACPPALRTEAGLPV
uniref:E3 ubiquitin-protein ligase NEURL3 n=1 Tax=Pipistrellus kuhlii TaxID=59472 RepID=A0A7J7TLS8_PIPKU|nr:neuralized E3 ubiquitin protein ligase 3 [Pipistrellus kuhlii]